MSPFAVLVWLAFGVLLRWTTPLLFHSLGWERLAWETGPGGAWLNRLVVIPPLVCIYQGDTAGLWRTACLMVSCWSGWWFIDHHRPLPSDEIPDLRVFRGRVPCGPMEKDEIMIRPFRMGTGLLAPFASRFFDKEWRRIPDGFRFPERSVLMERTTGTGTLMVVTGAATGLGASVGYGRPADIGIMRMMHVRTIPSPSNTIILKAGDDPDRLIWDCMLRYGAQVIAVRARRVKGSRHPRLACLAFMRDCAPIRRALESLDLYNLEMRDLGWMDDAVRACSIYDDAIRLHGPGSLFVGIAETVSRARSLRG